MITHDTIEGFCAGLMCGIGVTFLLMALFAALVVGSHAETDSAIDQTELE